MCEEELSYLSGKSDKLLSGIVSVTDEIKRSIENCCRVRGVTCRVSITQCQSSAELLCWSIEYRNDTHDFSRYINLEYSPGDDVYSMNGHAKTYRTIAAVAYYIVVEYPGDIDIGDIKGAIESCCKKYNVACEVTVKQCPCLSELSRWFIEYHNTTYGYVRMVSLTYFPRTNCYEINRDPKKYESLSEVAYGIVVKYSGD